ncbi:MAG: hypothetical protein Tsb0021_14470 [Chlamydiales bacterium]
MDIGAIDFRPTPVGHIINLEEKTYFKTYLSEDNGNHTVTLIAKESLTKSEKLWNTLLSLIGSRKWVKIEIKDKDQGDEKRQIYLSVEHIRDLLKLDLGWYKDADMLNRLRGTIREYNSFIEEGLKKDRIVTAKAKLNIQNDQKFAELVFKILSRRLKALDSDTIEEREVKSIGYYNPRKRYAPHIILNNNSEGKKALNLETFEISPYEE